MLYACYRSAVDLIATHFTTLTKECSHVCLCVTVTPVPQKGPCPRTVVWLRPPLPDSFSEALLKPRGSPAVEGHKQALPDLTLKLEGVGRRIPAPGDRAGRPLRPRCGAAARPLPAPRAPAPSPLSAAGWSTLSAALCTPPSLAASRPCCGVLCLRSP